MVHWVDPSETDPATWRGEDTEPDHRSVLERAAAAPVPYQYEDDVLHSGETVSEFRSREYTRARVIYNAGLEANRRLKLLTRGVLWGGGESHQRFKAQYRREAPPTETLPFDEYTVWTRFQFGEIERTDDTVRFRPGEGSASERVRTLAWGELYEPVRGRLVELELVRNPALARYRLIELGEWEEYRTAFVYEPSAFARGR